MEEPLSEEHPTVQAIKQAVLNHGWIILDQNAVDLVQRAKEISAQGELQKMVRELAPDYLQTPEGDRPEIPDDLIEEIAALLADHHPGH